MAMTEIADELAAAYSSQAGGDHHKLRGSSQTAGIITNLGSIGHTKRHSSKTIRQEDHPYPFLQQPAQFKTDLLERRREEDPLEAAGHAFSEYRDICPIQSIWSDFLVWAHDFVDDKGKSSETGTSETGGGRSP